MACTYPPKHKPNTPVEAPSADECRRPLPPRSATLLCLCPPSPQHPSAKGTLSRSSPGPPSPRKPCGCRCAAPCASFDPSFPSESYPSTGPFGVLMVTDPTLPPPLCHRRRGPGRVEANRRGRWNGGKGRRTVG